MPLAALRGNQFSARVATRVGAATGGAGEVGAMEHDRKIKMAMLWAADDARRRVCANPLPGEPCGLAADVVLRLCVKTATAWLATRLMAHSTIAAAELEVGPEVRLTHAARFENEFSEARRAALGRMRLGPSLWGKCRPAFRENSRGLVPERSLANVAYHAHADPPGCKSASLGHV